MHQLQIYILTSVKFRPNTSDDNYALCMPYQLQVRPYVGTHVLITPLISYINNSFFSDGPFYVSIRFIRGSSSASHTYPN